MAAAAIAPEFREQGHDLVREIDGLDLLDFGDLDRGRRLQPTDLGRDGGVSIDTGDDFAHAIDRHLIRRLGGKLHLAGDILEGAVFKRGCDDQLLARVGA